MRKLIQLLKRKSARIYHFITIAALLYGIWYWAYFMQGEKLATCIVMSFLAIFGQLTSLAQVFIGGMFDQLHRAFDGHTAQIDILRNALGFPTSKQGNNESQKD